MKDTDAISITPENHMTPVAREALTSLLLQMGDDELIFGHRSSEWLGLAPDLEEDIAFSSIAQDEIGHAALFYTMAQSITGTMSADEHAFSRTAEQRRNARLLEAENGDWAYTIARSYLYNAFEQVRLQRCLHSSYEPLQQAAAKILREERYHLLHMQTWFENLAVAKGEARTRLERALMEIWGELTDLFDTGAHSDALVGEKILPGSAPDLYRQWELVVRPVFEKVGIEWPGNPAPPSFNGRLGQHTEELTELLQTMTEVVRLDKEAVW